MKNIFATILTVATAAAILGGSPTSVFGQVDAGTSAKFLAQAKSASDSQLGPIAVELAGKAQSLSAAVGANDLIKSTLDHTLTSLTGGLDSAALGSAFKLVSAAKLTTEQLELAKQFGNLASAYVVQKNFSALDGAQGDVANLVNSLRSGKLKAALPSLKTIAQNVKLTATQKTLITTIADKYAPGLSKAAGAMDSLKKLPGF